MLTFAAAAAERQQRRQRAAQAVAAAADRRGGSCGSGGPCRGRVHGGGTCGVWQRRRQRWVWRQHWQRWVCRMPRMVLGHAATAVIALQHRHVAVACVVVWAWHVCVGGWGGLEKTVSGHAMHTPGTHQAHTRHTPGTCRAGTHHAYGMHIPCTHWPCTHHVNGTHRCPPNPTAK